MDIIQEMLQETLSEVKQTRAQVSRLEQRFDGLEQRFDGLEQRFDGLEQRFDELEKAVQETKASIIIIENEWFPKINLTLESVAGLNKAKIEHDGLFERHEEVLLNHNTRITKLELSAV